jgi:putative ABC transport system substrate-binding protein
MSVGRRQFVQGAGVAGLGLLAGCGQWPGQAQPVAKASRVGVLMFRREQGASADAAREQGSAADALREGLRDRGWVEGKNVALEWRIADADPERLAALAAELAQLPVDVIVTGGEPSVLAAKQATSTIPIVMAASGDPVSNGLVASLAHPGGNVTGLSVMNSQMSGKRLELLNEVVPGLARVAYFSVPANPSDRQRRQDIAAAARVLGIELHIVEVREANELEGAFETVVEVHAGALVVPGTPLLTARSARIAELALRARIPSM